MLEDHEGLMEKMNTWNFQIFDLVDKTGGKTGRILSYVSTTTTNQPSAVAVELCFNWLVCPILINILRKMCTQCSMHLNALMVLSILCCD